MISGNNFHGYTVAEICISVALSAAVMLSVMQVVSRTRGTFKYDSDLLNTQMILDSIINRLRSDVRTMTIASYKFEAGKSFTFSVKGEKGEEKEITYKYKDKTLSRIDKDPKGEKKTNFYCEGQIESFNFKWVPSKNPYPDCRAELPYLFVAIQIVSNEKGQDKPVYLPFISSFHPRQFYNGLPFLGGVK